MININTCRASASSKVHRALNTDTRNNSVINVGAVKRKVALGRTC